MESKIKCDQIQEWNYDTCWNCRHFSSHKIKTGHRYRCSLNKEARYARTFSTIWCIELLIDAGILKEKSRDTVIVEYQDKKPKKHNA